MEINFGYIICIIVIGSLCWYGNEILNKMPLLKPIVSFLIVAVAVICLLDALGLMHGIHSMRVN